jgi:ABC-type glycerol-3-phosphate transport system substrate-binding protein
MSPRPTRKAVAIAIAACIGLSAAACSSSGSSGGGDQSGGVADGKPLDPNVKVTVSIDCAPASDQPGQQAQYNDDLATFKIKYPNVTINPLPKTKCEDPAPFTAMLKAHSETDAFYAYFTDKNQVLDSGDAVDISKYVNDQTVPQYKDLLPTIKENITDGSKVYGLPKTYYVTGLVYNRDLFKQAGLDPDQPPTTWDQVAADAAKISALGNGISGYEDYSGGGTGGWHFTSEIYSLGGQMVNADGTKAAFNSAQGKQVLQTLKDMRWQTHGIGPTPVTQWADAFPPLAAGKVGMFLGAPDVIQRLTNVLGANPSPYGLAALPGGKGAQMGGDMFYFKKTDTPNEIKAAIAWINYEYMTPGVGQFNYERNKALSGDPGTNKFIEVGLPEPNFWTAGTSTATSDASSLKDNANMPVANYGPYVNTPVPGIPEPPAAQQLYQVLDTAMSAVMTDPNANIDQLLSTAETKANQILANQ